MISVEIQFADEGFIANRKCPQWVFFLVVACFAILKKRGKEKTKIAYDSANKKRERKEK